MVRHHADDRPGHPEGPVSICSPPMLPHQPAPARRPGGAAAGKPARWRPRLRSTLVRARHGQRRTTLFPSGPMQAGDHAAHRPRRHVDHWPRPGRPATPSHPGSSADSPAAAPRTPETRLSGHPDAPDAWTPDTWTPDVRSTGWTDVPTTGPWTRTTTGWPASGHSWRPAITRWAARLHRVTAPGGARPAMTAPGDGPCAAALTAAITGQLPSTARHEAAPPAHCCPRTISGRA
jgi:hypothetical protein